MLYLPIWIDKECHFWRHQIPMLRHGLQHTSLSQGHDHHWSVCWKPIKMCDNYILLVQTGRTTIGKGGVSLVWSMPEYCYSPLDRMLVHRRVKPSSMSPVPIYTPGWRETMWSRVPCQGNIATMLQIQSSRSYPLGHTWLPQLGRTGFPGICWFLLALNKKFIYSRLSSKTHYYYWPDKLSLNYNVLI